MTIVVSATASAGGSGTAESPFRTVTEACGLASAGDTVLLEDGVYRECLTPVRSGTSDRPIVFAALHPGQVTIECPEQVKERFCVCPAQSGADWITLRGIRFVYGAVCTGRTLGWLIEDCEILRSPHFGLILGEAGIALAQDTAQTGRSGFQTVRRCEIHDCTAAGIAVASAAVRIESCQVHGCGGGVLLHRDAFDAELIDNRFCDNVSEDLCIETQGRGAQVKGNRFLSARSVNLLMRDIDFSGNEFQDGGPGILPFGGLKLLEEPVKADLEDEPMPLPEAEEEEEEEQEEAAESIGANLVLIGCESCVFPLEGESFTVKEIYVRGNEVWIISAEHPEEAVQLDCGYGFFKHLSQPILQAPFSVDVSYDRNLQGIVNTLATMYRLLTRSMVQDPQVVCGKIRDKANETLEAVGITMRFTPQLLKFIRNRKFITLEEVIDTIAAGDREVVAEVVAEGREL